MVKISGEAMDYIARRINEAKSTRPPTAGDIPLLVWISKAYFVDHSGQRTERGPYFGFHWTNREEVEQYGYLTLLLTGGDILALAPGNLFRAASRSIERKGDGITLVPGE